MKTKHMLTLVASVMMVIAATMTLSAQPPNPPPFYAIENARIVTGTGTDLERATVLIADGLIEAIGTDIEIPADALVMDGEGLVVLAGLFDSLTSLGMQAPEPSGGGARGAGRSEGPTIRGPQDRPSTTPWKNPADELDTDDSRLEKWREQGFTHAVTAPTDGLFAGQGVVIALAGTEASQMVVKSAVAQSMNMRASGFRNFPGSLMGVLSYFRQVFLDTQHYGDARELYDADPAGLDRPAYDRTLDPLLMAMTEGTPFLIPADRGRHIDRAMILANDFGLTPILVGGQGAYERIDELAKSKTALVVGLDWPEGAKDRAPDAEDSFRELAHRRLAPAVPGQLADAGVPFAFTSSGGSASDAIKGIRAAVDAGLSNEAALAALTTTPASLFGVAEQLGTVERGKIANLILATDYPWAEDAEIKAVFVDGRRFAERESKEASAPPSTDPSGTWAITMTSPRGEREMTAEFTMAEDGKLTGEVKSERSSTEIEDGKVEGDRLSFKTTQTMGPRTMEATYSGLVDGESLSGNMSAGPMSLEFQGERTAAAKLSDSADGETSESDGPAVSLGEIRDTWTVFQGPVNTEADFAITNATIHTVSGDVIEGGTVVVRDGKIRSVSSNARVPRGVRTIDGTGKHVTPGIIDAHSHLAIEGGTNEGSLVVTAMVGIDDVVDPDDIGIYRALAGGVTAANVLHGSANPIGGRNQVIKLRWGTDAATMKMSEAAPGIKFALGENPKRSRGNPGGTSRYPTTRMGVMDVIRDAFVEAKEYQKAWAGYRSGQSAGKRAIPPRKDLKLQTLAEILEGKRLVHTHSYRADEILQMLRIAEEFGFRVATLQHVLEGYKVADEIAAHGAGASTFSDWWGYKVEAFDAIPHNAALMTDRGVVVSINSDSNEEIRHLNHEAAKTVRWGGLTDNQALALITLNPAKQLKIDEFVGSIEVGKQADLVIYDGHPLSVRSVVEKTFVDGVLYFDLAADRTRQAALADIKKRMEGVSPDDDSETDEEPTETTTPRTSPDPDDFERLDSELLSADLFAGAGEGTYSCREVHYQ